MPEALLPEAEPRRLDALQLAGLLDGPPDPAFDEVARLAARICGTPTALVSFVAEARQWFKTRVGLEAPETPRSASFCAHAIREEQGIVVPDATKDPRFADNPLVVGPPGIRFYAGAPLRLSTGEALGTLTVIDYVPRALSAERVEALRVLARQVTLQIELRIKQRELEQANASLAERAADLARLNEELDAFAHTVSHELRGPLHVVQGHADALREEFAAALGPDGCGRLARIEAVAQRMAKMIDGLLSLSQVARANVERTDVDISALAGEIVGDLREASPNRRVRVDIEPGLRAHASEGMVRTVLENLLRNAWKITEAQDEAHIRVGSDEAGRYFVRDDGPGFDMRDGERIWEPFQRIGKNKLGAGIGLATVRRAVLRHGGDVRAEAAPGQGATFYFTLPEPVAA